MAVSLTVPRRSPYYYGGGGRAPILRPPRPIPLTSVTARPGHRLPGEPVIPGVGPDASPPYDYTRPNPFDVSKYGLDPGTGYALPPVAAPTDTAPPATPAAPGVPPPGSPDWQGLIGGSWEVSQAQAAMAAQMARARANFQASLRQGFIDLGASNAGQLGNLGQYIDKDTMQAAIHNKYSTYSQIAQEQARTNATNYASLAARGILSSGQTTKSAQDVVNAAEQARYTALRQFLSGGQQGLIGLGDLEAQQAQALMAAQFAAAQRLAQQYPYYGAGGTPGAPYAGTGPYAGTPTSDVYYEPASQYVPTGALPQGSPTGIPDWSWFSQYGGGY